jgi:hypothetical protein
MERAEVTARQGHRTRRVRVGSSLQADMIILEFCRSIVLESILRTCREARSCPPETGDLRWRSIKPNLDSQPDPPSQRVLFLIKRSNCELIQLNRLNIS